MKKDNITLNLISVKKKMPELDKFQESDYCFCMEVNSITPVIAYYRNNSGWIVAHYKADSMPITVIHWCYLPKILMGD